MTDRAKHYLGDGCYVAFDGMHVVLTTENGIIVTNRVCLDSQVLDAFEGWLTRQRSGIPEFDTVESLPEKNKRLRAESDAQSRE